MANLSLSGVRKSYGATEVLHGIDLSVESGEFVVFVGPSGCGKSTLLRMMAGLEEISAGTFAIDGREANDVPPARRGIAMVFQSYALYPHMNVRENMGFGLRMARIAKPEREARVARAAEMLQLTPYLDRLPRELSGGQRQRVAIGRAITRDPKVFLFDEPLSNLDAALRVATRIEIAKLKESMPGTTMVYVTHDQVEAMTLADKIVVMNQGRIEQVGSPIELYETPANLFVARFIGSPAMNTDAVSVDTAGESATILASGGNRVPTNATIPAGFDGPEVTIGVRPEDLVLAEGDSFLFEGSLTLVEQLGEATIAYVDIGTGQPLIAKLPGIVHLDRNRPIRLGAERDRIHVFDSSGKAFVRTNVRTGARRLGS